MSSFACVAYFVELATVSSTAGDRLSLSSVDVAHCLLLCLATLTVAKQTFLQANTLIGRWDRGRVLGTVPSAECNGRLVWSEPKREQSFIRGLADRHLNRTEHWGWCEGALANPSLPHILSLSLIKRHIVLTDLAAMSKQLA